MTNCLYFSSREGGKAGNHRRSHRCGTHRRGSSKKKLFSADCRKKSGPFLFSSSRKEIRSHPPTLVLPWVGSWDKTIIHRFSSPSFFFFYICQIDIIDHGSWWRGKRTGDQRKEGGREDRPPPPPKPFGKSGLINLASAAKRGEEGRRKRKRREKRVSLPRAKTFKGLMNDFGYSLSVFLLFIEIPKFSE